MYLFFPEMLLVIVPLLFVFFWRGRGQGIGGAARLVIIGGLALLAAVPLARIGGRGVDVVIVADLSHSMPAGSRDRQLEIIRLIENQRGPGDRVGIVTFGREARIEQLPRERGETSGFIQEVDPDGSDLGGAIGLASSLVPRERPGRIVVISDGEANGSPVMAAAQDSAARGLPVDFRGLSRGQSADAAVESLELPGTVDEGEPFQFSAWVRTDRSIDAEAVLLRDGVELARQKQTFNPGPTELTFRDVIDHPGVAHYQLRLDAPGDRIPENNIGSGAVRVEAPAALLLVNTSGNEDNFSRALAASKLHVQIRRPETLPHDVSGLLAFRGVVLENVSASQVGPEALGALTRFAADLGGGLLLTGGGASFGVGGYFKSVLDPYLPVSMEIKNEHRKLSLAMVVTLDRSGSMAAPVGDGRTKMDLANLGTCGAIDTLGPYDEVGVIAVDSAPHIISPLTSASDKDEICAAVRTIRSMGGGIFTYTALASAAAMIQKSDKGTRHIVLFADAADAEEPGDYQRLMTALDSAGITVSVIGLGSETDKDAEFLKDVAKRGHGRIQFTANVDELPRLFAQEAITVARSSFIDQPTPARSLSDMVLLGDLPSSKFPSLDGYNLSYLRPGATIGVVTDDEYHAPVLSFWHRGLGRVAALTAEVDGKYSQSLNAWKDFGPFTAGLARWLMGGEPPQGVQASIERQGGEGVVRVELDPDRKHGSPADIRAATAVILPPGGAASAKSERLELAWVGENALEARFPVRNNGIYLGAVDIGQNNVLSLAPLTLPYSPEYEPRPDPAEGEKTLSEMARLTGGVERTSWGGIFSSARLRDLQVRDLVIPLAVMILLLHLSEIAGRRLFVFAAWNERLRTMRLPRFSRRPAREAAVEAQEVSPGEAATVPEPPDSLQPEESPLARAKAKARPRIRR
jgi:Mg-chelatase subunit ChlD